MSKLKDSLSDSRTLPAWAGTIDDLAPVLEAMERQYADLRADYIEREMRHPRTMLELAKEMKSRTEADAARFASDDSAAASFAARILDATTGVEQAEEQVRVALEKAERVDNIDLRFTTAKGADRKVTGSPAELLDYLAHKDPHDLTLRAPAGTLLGYRLTVECVRSTGVRISVTGDDSRWADAALVQVLEAMGRKVPKWHLLRKQRVLYPFFWLAFITATFLAFPAPQPNEGGSLAYGAIVGIVVMLAVIGSAALFRRLVPAFEILPPGAKSRVDRIVYFVLGTLGTVALGVLVNRIS